MTTNQTIDGVLVPRELIEWLVTPGNVMDLGGRREELRALLDAERCTSCDGSGDLIDLTGEWRGYCVCPAGVALKNKPAAQSQGVPVAWVECSPAWLEAGGDCATAPRLCVGREGISHLHPAHVEQPAPVAVVPEQTYRLLGDGDVIMDGDKTLNDDTATWGKVPMGVFIGMPYNRRVMLPVRRAKP